MNSTLLFGSYKIIRSRILQKTTDQDQVNLLIEARLHMEALARRTTELIDILALQKQPTISRNLFHKLYSG